MLSLAPGAAVCAAGAHRAGPCAQSDEGRQRLRAQVLSPEDALAAALSWRDDCAGLSVEAAAAWMPPPPHFGPCVRRAPGRARGGGAGAAPAQPGRGLAGVEVTDAAPEALQGPPGPSARGLAERMDVDEGAGAGCEARAPALRGRLAAATGHAYVCGIALPCGPGGGDGGGGGGGGLVRTPTAERNLEAAALALCQQRPLLLEGPPGALLAPARGPARRVSVHEGRLAVAACPAPMTSRAIARRRCAKGCSARHAVAAATPGVSAVRHQALRRVRTLCSSTRACVSGRARAARRAARAGAGARAGSGKSALAAELARLTGNAAGLIRVHVDDQMDAKALLGAYVCTAVPGEFAWQPGPLTQARRRAPSLPAGAGVVAVQGRSASARVRGCATSRVRRRRRVQRGSCNSLMLRSFCAPCICTTGYML